MGWEKKEYKDVGNVRRTHAQRSFFQDYFKVLKMKARNNGKSKEEKDKLERD